MEILSLILVVLIGLVGFVLVHFLAFFIGLILNQILNGDESADDAWAYTQEGIERPYLFKIRICKWKWTLFA